MWSKGDTRYLKIFFRQHFHPLLKGDHSHQPKPPARLHHLLGQVRLGLQPPNQTSKFWTDFPAVKLLRHGMFCFLWIFHVHFMYLFQPLLLLLCCNLLPALLVSHPLLLDLQVCQCNPSPHEGTLYAASRLTGPAFLLMTLTHHCHFS